MDNLRYKQNNKNITNYNKVDSDKYKKVESLKLYLLYK